MVVFLKNIAIIKVVTVTKGQGMEYTNKLVTELIPYASNARTHSEEQVTQIASSIREFGFINPIIIDDKNNVIAGHGRLLASKKLGLKEVPTLQVDHLTDTQRKAYILADNQLALNAGWNDELLKLELAGLDDVGFNLELLGFDLKSLGSLTEEIEGLTDEDDVPNAPFDYVTKVGDIWKLGNHRLMCGDSTSIDALEKLLDGKKADMVWTDPPYNVNVQGQAGSIINDNMSDESFNLFLKDVYSCLFLAMKSGAVIYVAHADTERVNFTKTFTESGLKLSQVLIWVKNSGTLSRQDFNWQHEPILYGWKEGEKHYFCQDFTRTTVIDDDLDIKKLNKKELEALVNSMRTELKKTVLRENRPTKSELHPTMKPVSLVQRMIEWSSQHEDIVLDVFGGSGSTLIACEKTSRLARIMELDPRYCDVIIKRWQDFTGKQATLESTGETYNSLEA